MFYIGTEDNMYYPIYDDRNLGAYNTVQRAVEDLAHGHTFSIPECSDIECLKISDHLEDWENVSSL